MASSPQVFSSDIEKQPLLMNYDVDKDPPPAANELSINMASSQQVSSSNVEKQPLLTGSNMNQDSSQAGNEEGVEHENSSFFGLVFSLARKGDSISLLQMVTLLALALGPWSICFLLMITRTEEVCNGRYRLFTIFILTYYPAWVMCHQIEHTIIPFLSRACSIGEQYLLKRLFFLLSVSVSVGIFSWTADLPCRL